MSLCNHPARVDIGFWLSTFGAGVWQHGTIVKTCSLFWRSHQLSAPLCSFMWEPHAQALGPRWPILWPMMAQGPHVQKYGLPFWDWLQNVGWTILRYLAGSEVFLSHSQNILLGWWVVAWVFRSSCSYLLQLVAGANDYNDCDTYDVFWSGAQRCPFLADRNYVCCYNATLCYREIWTSRYLQPTIIHLIVDLINVRGHVEVQNHSWSIPREDYRGSKKDGNTSRMA
jgi:hypothetical protein